MQASTYRATSLPPPSAGGDDARGDTVGDSGWTMDDGFARADQ